MTGTLTADFGKKTNEKERGFEPDLTRQSTPVTRRTNNDIEVQWPSSTLHLGTITSPCGLQEAQGGKSSRARLYRRVIQI